MNTKLLSNTVLLNILLSKIEYRISKRFSFFLLVLFSSNISTAQNVRTPPIVPGSHGTNFWVLIPGGLILWSLAKICIKIYDTIKHMIEGNISTKGIGTNLLRIILYAILCIMSFWLLDYLI